MNSAVECAFLWRWQILKSPWLPWFRVEWYRHTVLCILPFAWEVNGQRQSEMIFYHVYLDLTVCYIPRVAMFMVYWAWQSADGTSLLKLSWKVVRIRRKWRTHSICCLPHAVLFPYFESSFLLSPLLDISRFRHFNIWKQKMQCSDTTSSQVLLAVLATVLKIAIKMHKSKSFSRLFRWREKKKKTHHQPKNNNNKKDQTPKASVSAKTKMFAALHFRNTQTSVLHPNLMAIGNLKRLSPTHPKVNE